MQTITPEQLKEKMKSESIELLDVRTPAEYREIHVQGAFNVPLDSLDPNELEQSRNGTAGQPLYVICRSGNRSSKACQKFLDSGHGHVINVEGGTQACEAAGLPVRRGKKTISLERQVRIAAGFLAFIGAVLGFFVNTWFVGISAFVGAGLMFAGITDTCGMGMMLAKMPWNQVRDTSPNCPVDSKQAA